VVYVSDNRNVTDILHFLFLRLNLGAKVLLFSEKSLLFRKNVVILHPHLTM
jgi:hypothetical protein